MRDFRILISLYRYIYIYIRMPDQCSPRVGRDYCQRTTANWNCLFDVQLAECLIESPPIRSHPCSERTRTLPEASQRRFTMNAKVLRLFVLTAAIASTLTLGALPRQNARKP